MSISRGRLLGLVIVSFLFGAVGASIYDRPAGGNAGESRKRFSSKDLMQELSLELDLDSLQARQMEVILDDGTQRLKESARNWKQDYRAIRNQTYDKLRDLLSPGQIKKFNTIVDRRHDKH